MARLTAPELAEDRPSRVDTPAASGRRGLAAFVGLLFALAFAVCGLGRLLAPGAGLPDLIARELVDWAEAAFLLAWLVFVEQRPFRSIGFRAPTWRTLLWGIVGAVVLIAISAVYYGLLAPRIGVDVGVANGVRASIMKQPLWYRLALVLRAAVYEEFLFRAYIMEKIRQLTGSWILAAAISVATFAYAHLAGWGWAQLIPVCGAGAMLSALYVWRRDLPSNMLAHFLTDTAGFLLG